MQGSLSLRSKDTLGLFGAHWTSDGPGSRSLTFTRPEMRIPLGKRSILFLHEFYKFIGETREAWRQGLNKDKSPHINSTNAFIGGRSLQGYSQL